MRNLLLLTLLLPHLVLAWGEDGHRVVCEIAYAELSSPARAEVDRLLAIDPGFDTFAESCLFADAPERIRVIDHYMNVPRSYRAITTAECPMADSCLLPAIRTDSQILLDPRARDEEKLLALKLLGHWVGDIHQPFHVSFQDDRGANSIFVNGTDPEKNLHGVWDYDIFSSNYGNDYRQIATDFRVDINDDERLAWRHDSPVEWANESLQITLSKSAQYCTHKQGACWYTADNMLLSRGETWKQLKISKRYLRRHGPVVRKRLQQAGVRLAAILNRTLTEATP